MSLSKKEILNHYSRKDVQKELLLAAKNREVGIRYGENGFGKRPDILQFWGDVLDAAKSGATSFHLSEEHWKDPLAIKTGMNKKQLDELRIGFDNIIDIDCKFFEYSKITAELILETLKFYGLQNIGLKFSGNRSFHIGIPFKAFPKRVNNIQTNSLFPETPRIIASYIKELIRERLTTEILKLSNIREIAKSVGKEEKALLENNLFNPYSIIEIDTILISSRHLYRAPYSIAYDESILIRSNNKTRIMKIGDYVDSFFTTEKKFQEKDISNLNHRTISIKLNNSYRARTKKINKVIRHEIDEPLYRIYLVGGRKIDVTSGHSLFILNDGRLETIKGNKITLGDYLLVPKKINLEGELRKINLAENIIDIVTENELKYFFLSDFDKKIFDTLYKLNQKLKIRFKNIYNWRKLGIIPLNAYKFFSEKDKRLKKRLEKSKLSLAKHGGKAYKVNNVLKINKDLVRLLGYYSAEGNCSKLNDNGRKYRVVFSFGSHEKKIIADCKKIVKKLFNIPIEVRQPHKTAIQLILNSRILNFIFIKLFCCGRTSKDKRVPNIIWDTSDEFKKEYLKNYLLGDGCLTKVWSKNSVATVSERLKEDLCFLLTALGLNFILTRQTSKGSFSSKTPHANFIHIIGKEDVESLGFKSNNIVNKNPAIRRYPIKELGLERQILKTHYRNIYLKGKIKSRSLEWIIKNLNPSKEVIKLLKGDIGFLKVKKIEEIAYKKKYVYDLSIKDDENFIGGNCILLHNSLNEKSGLISIPIELSRLKDFKLSQAKPENVVVGVKFLDEDAKEGGATELIIQAFDWYSKNNKREEKNPIITPNIANVSKIPIKEDYFPPCIKLLLNGVQKDGRKRAVFILTNFLFNMNWDIKKIEEFILEWNKKNYEPLKEGYIKSQINWFNRQKQSKMPPNCENEAYYKDIGVCQPDNLCKLIKNPVNYSLRKIKFKKSN